MCFSRAASPKRRRPKRSCQFDVCKTMQRRRASGEAFGYDLHMDVEAEEIAPPKIGRDGKKHLTYKVQWEYEEPFKDWVAQSPRGMYYAHCRTCMRDISCRAGRQCLENHMRTAAHVNFTKKFSNIYRPIVADASDAPKVVDHNVVDWRVKGVVAEPDKVKDLDLNALIDSRTQPTTLDIRTKEAELRICCFIVKYNLPLDAVPRLVKLISTSFPESPVAVTLNLNRVLKILSIVRNT